jgi:DNA-binding MarR family transcriptional regulator
MDAVMFELKAAHLSVQKVGRGLLRDHERMTVARFDLMNALGSEGMKQSDLWKRLNVVRSAVCQLVRTLMELGWVKRVRAADSRTWLVTLTRKGREAFQRVNEAQVESGNVAVWMDYGLAREQADSDAQDIRETLWWHLSSISTTFRTMPWWHGDDLYWCDPEDYWHWFTWPGESAGELPWVEA